MMMWCCRLARLLAIAKAPHSDSFSSTVLTNLGLAPVMAGDYEVASESYKEALEVIFSMNVPANALCGTGSIAGIAKHPAQIDHHLNVDVLVLGPFENFGLRPYCHDPFTVVPL